MSRKKKGRKMKEPAIEIVLLRNPDALQIPDIEDLFIRAFQGHRWVDGKAVMQTVQFMDLENRVGVLLARKDGEWAGLAMVSGPRPPISPWPLVYWLYGQGPVRDALAKACVAWARERENAQILTTNYRLDRSKSFVRLFGRFTRQAKVVGEVVAFDIRE